MVTLDDIADVVATIDQYAAEICGLQGYDCDAPNNIETLRYSVRDRRFPSLQDKLDVNGNVVTKGEQFHAIITRPPFLKRRQRAGQAADQIELVLQLPVTLQEGVGEDVTWMIDPLSCNHVLTSADPNGISASGVLGTVAVNVIGHNLPEQEPVRYELVRGATDYQRACAPESVQEEFGTLPTYGYPIRTQIVGYAPQNPLAQGDAPPTYVTWSQALSSCTNAEENGGLVSDPACWRLFARDRSLSSLDWKLVIPLRVGDGALSNAWVLGEGLPSATRPVIEDIVVYFRYSSLPLAEY